MVSGCSFSSVLAPGGRITLRWPLEADFEVFWALVAEWLSDDPWRLILRCVGPWCQNSSQMASGGHFELFRALVAE